MSTEKVTVKSKIQSITVSTLRIRFIMVKLWIMNNTRNTYCYKSNNQYVNSITSWNWYLDGWTKYKEQHISPISWFCFDINFLAWQCVNKFVRSIVCSLVRSFLTSTEIRNIFSFKWRCQSDTIAYSKNRFRTSHFNYEMVFDGNTYNVCPKSIISKALYTSKFETLYVGIIISCLCSPNK